ncbi:hypothetical protein BDM02DRAFT_3108045 [Thelephora ganbajun]|uniref:Uncharacterized protein n=1 Tax=Thelephora ganbajun TaxID=370292 RepID=A0ACB6ZVA7_THEGA|nr:hypothetical protein BDM02DRAFT_3108045 [Thelephora ganbajun]
MAMFPVPTGSAITTNVARLHYNSESPRMASVLRLFTENHVWEDPFAFKPERFMGEWDKDAFIPFSRRARTCIGRG